MGSSNFQLVFDALQLTATVAVSFASVRYANRLLNDDSLRKKVDQNTSDIAHIQGVISGLFRIERDHD